MFNVWDKDMKIYMEILSYNLYKNVHALKSLIVNFDQVNVIVPALIDIWKSFFKVNKKTPEISFLENNINNVCYQQF